MKTCIKCNIPKPLCRFEKSSSSENLVNVCKYCRRGRKSKKSLYEYPTKDLERMSIRNAKRISRLLSSRKRDGYNPFCIVCGGKVHVSRSKYCQHHILERRKKQFRKYHKIKQLTSSEYRTKNSLRSSIWKKDQVKNLTDGYLKMLLSRGTELSSEDITQEMIEINRKQIKLKRDVKKEQSKQCKRFG